MVLVDTTVWIDFFGNRAQPHVAVLRRLIENGEDLCLCGLVLAEILQGIRSDSAYRRTKDYLSDLIYLPMRRTTFVRAAEMYRSLRKKGITIRKPVDCMIASVAIEHDLALLHNDRDFDQIARHSKLKVATMPPA
ncbi:MAG: PIN domain nuclease [Thermoguttaceae bacterium]|jgi:predicted nucleic acid-binding protein|nr:PIN domain nuclease [Thermoguttaceae bacterium]